VSLTFGIAESAEREAALRLFFRHAPDSEREDRVRRGLELIERGELGPDGLLICKQDGAVAGAMVALVLAGAAGLVWPPVLADGVDEAAAGRLVDLACGWLRQRGCKLAQALLGAGDRVGALPARGFTQITDLYYLQRPLAELPPQLAGLTLDAYPACDPKLFARTLVATYEGAYDCPELNGLRTADEVVAGYRGTPGSDVRLWWFARCDTRPAGVLLVTPVPNTNAWDLSYVGLLPSARGAGLGTALTRHALHAARAGGAERLTLTMDRRNAPARRMYARLGFEEFDRRAVYLKVLS
jgi:ribosomal protein S18 acetylase RimI-like enzyme